MNFLKNLEKQRAESKIIHKLNIRGNTTTDQTEILNEQKRFYQSLYQKRDRIETAYPFYDHQIPQLTEREKGLCEGFMSEKECAEAVKEMKNGKTPGTDGLTVEFYKIFWFDIKELMLKSFNYSFQTNSLSELQKLSLITLLPKTNKDLTNLSNWRPISILNVEDYRIMAKTIANRVKKVLTNLVDSSQTGFIKGRYIGENIRLLFDIIEYTEEHDAPGILLFTDFEKAFDSINHEYITEILNLFNFGPDLKSWINLFYHSATSCVLYNGYTTDFVPIQRGVRQGCPLSPYIFILGTEILSIAIKQ